VIIFSYHDYGSDPVRVLCGLFYGAGMVVVRLFRPVTLGGVGQLPLGSLKKKGGEGCENEEGKRS